MTFPTGQLPPDVIHALEQGRKIDAIKRLRKLTGWGLAETKAIVDAYLRNRQGASTFGEAHATHESDDTGGHEFTPRDQGEALRLHPAALPNQSGLAPGEVKQSNAAAWTFAILVVVLVAYYFLGRSSL